MNPKKLGRPKSDNPKSFEIKVRATKADRDKLLLCCEKTGRSQYEIVIEGINRIYKEIIEQHERR